MTASAHPYAPIRKLPDLLVNKIAAGEVIERPASVVKELLENAIDAGASRIQLDIQEGGSKLIRITDNGRGIAADQLALAVTPHATSKVQQEDDLYDISTLGFRGEALASVGAVSHLRLISRPADSPAGARIDVAGERIESQDQVGCAPGTAVEVRDLFFNVPARRKFLKATATEVGHITEQLARVALAHLGIEFVMAHNGRITKRLTATEDLRSRIGDFFGSELAANLIPLSCHSKALHISGLIAPPAESRNSSKWQYLFLNRRFIRDRNVQHAVRESYRGLMEPARHPVVFLFLDIDPTRVDVNVHPTKTEVRWQEGPVVHSQVLAALRESLRGADLTPALHTRRVETTGPSVGTSPPRPDVETFFNRDLSHGGRSVAPPQSGGPMLTRAVPKAAPLANPTQAEGRPIPAAQLHRSYIVTETDDGIMIIDQHALHERIIFDRLTRRIADHPLESQALLIPETVEATAQQIAAIETHTAILERMGLRIGRYGESTLAIHAAPAIVKPDDLSTLVLDLADLLISRATDPTTEELIHASLDMMSCKAAVKAGDPLTHLEIQDLVRKRHLVDKGTNCPHGRPTALRFSLADLARQFKRT
jgi:DNA mismatch repair protein MutL